MKTSTGNSLLKAWNRAAKKFDREPKLTATSVSAGYVIPPGQKSRERTGWQVFVTMIRFSEKRLKENPISGGLARKP